MSRVWRSAWRPTSSTWLRRNPLGRRFFSHLAKSAKRFCALKDVKDSVCKWYPSLEVEVPAALLLHVTRYSIFSNSSIISPGLRASIGVTRSYSSRPFLCALVTMIEVKLVSVSLNQPYNTVQWVICTHNIEQIKAVHNLMVAIWDQQS